MPFYVVAKLCLKLRVWNFKVIKSIWRNCISHVLSWVTWMSFVENSGLWDVSTEGGTKSYWQSICLSKVQLSSLLVYNKILECHNLSKTWVGKHPEIGMPCLGRGVGAKVYSVVLKVHFCARRTIETVRKWVKQVRMKYTCLLISLCICDNTDTMM